MSKICYTVFDGEGDLLSYEAIGNGSLSVRVEGEPSGKLFIGNLILDCERGIAEGRIDRLEDGVYQPMLYTEREMIAFPRVVKIGKAIRPSILHEEEILRSSERARRAIEESRATRAEVERLRALIEGSALALGDGE